MSAQPKIEILGVYLPTADKDAFESFVAEKCREFADVAPSRRDEIEEEYRDGLGESALIEALITNADERFDVGDFCQPDPSLDRSHWQVAWCETFLASDGESVLPCEPLSVPSATVFRVAFYIHYWQPLLGLQSSYGALALPTPQAVPPRLWALAQYETVD